MSRSQHLWRAVCSRDGLWTLYTWTSSWTSLGHGPWMLRLWPMNLPGISHPHCSWTSQYKNKNFYYNSKYNVAALASMDSHQSSISTTSSSVSLGSGRSRSLWKIGGFTTAMLNAHWIQHKWRLYWCRVLGSSNPSVTMLPSWCWSLLFYLEGSSAGLSIACMCSGKSTWHLKHQLIKHAPDNMLMIWGPGDAWYNRGIHSSPNHAQIVTQIMTQIATPITPKHPKSWAQITIWGFGQLGLQRSKCTNAWILIA